MARRVGATVVLVLALACTEDADTDPCEAAGSTSAEDTGGGEPVVCSEVEEDFANDPDNPDCGTGLSAQGRWSDVSTELFPLMAIHAIHRPRDADHPDGSILLIGERDAPEMLWPIPPPCDFGATEDCPVPVGNLTEALHPSDLFCAAHVGLQDGSTLVVGGQYNPFVNFKGLPVVSRLTADGAWEDDPDGLSTARWYPTTTVLGDGRVLITAGTEVVLEDDPSGLDYPCETDDDCYGRCPFTNDMGQPEIARCTDDADCVGIGGTACLFTAHPTLPGNSNRDLDCSASPHGGLGGCECDGTITNPNDGNASDVVGGLCRIRSGAPDAADGQIYDPGAAGSALGASFDVSLGGTTPLPTYPLMYVLPDRPGGVPEYGDLGGWVFYAGSEVGSSARIQPWVFDPSETTGGLEKIKISGSKSCTPGSSAAMYEPGKIIKFGGGSNPSKITEVIDFTADACPRWRQTDSHTTVPRHFSHAVILPTGDVLAVSGNQHDPTAVGHDHSNGENDDDAPDIVTETELWNPGTEAWCTLASASDLPQHYRGYHSQAFLIPDGRVLLTGSGYGFSDSNTDKRDFQVYSPPYFFQGLPRPELLLPPAIAYPGGTLVADGGELTLDFTGSPVPVHRVALVKLAAQTHQNDMEARYVPLETVEVEDTQITVVRPPNLCHATPGPYMLFGLHQPNFPDDDGEVPSVGQYVMVTGDDCERGDASQPDIADPVTFSVDNGTAYDGLAATCREPGIAEIGLSTFGHTLESLCDAMPLCPGVAGLELTVEVLASAMSNGDPPPTVTAMAATGATADAERMAFGAGQHALELCATLAGTGGGCVTQNLQINGPIADAVDAFGHYAGAIASDFVALAARVPETLSFSGDAAAEVWLPAELGFHYYGEPIHVIYVGRNGGIRLSPGEITGTNTALPSTAADAPELAVLWQSIDLGPGAVRTNYDRSAERFIVSWEDVRSPVDPSRPLDFQAHLYGDGRIDFQYREIQDRDPAMPATPTIGIQEPGGVDALGLVNAAPTPGLSDRGLAITDEACVASPLRFPGWVTCEPLLDVSDVELASCRPDGDIFALPRPRISEICETQGELEPLGRLAAAGTGPEDLVELQVPLPVGPQTKLAPGTYRIDWYVGMTYAQGTGRGTSFVSGPFPQIVTVVLKDEGDAQCCSPEQELVLLSTHGDLFVDLGGDDECVLGFQGGDAIIVGGGSDTVVAGQGRDLLVLGDGADVGFGEGGRDVLVAGDGPDVVYGGSRADLLDGGSGSDLLHAGAGKDFVLARDGDDELWGRAGNDILVGGDGDDRLYPGSGRDVSKGGKGDDVFYVLDACELRSGEVFVGGPGDDVVLVPEGVDLAAHGVILVGIEQVGTLLSSQALDSECAP